MSDKKDKTFNIDAEATGIIDIPSVTRLLNRKSLNLKPATSSSASTQAAPEAPPEPEAPEVVEAPAAFDGGDSGGIDLGEGPSDFHLESSTSPVAPQAATILVRPAASRQSPRPSPLILWKIEDLKKNSDPMGKALATLVEGGGLKFAVFLGIDAASPQKFQATAALAPKEKTELWTGMKWDPKTAPDIWGIFLKSGQIELTPPGTVTNAMSSRNLVRGAFGVDQKEWITLVRVGPATNCRGMVALISNASIQTQLAAVIPLFAAVPQSS